MNLKIATSALFMLAAAAVVSAPMASAHAAGIDCAALAGRRATTPEFVAAVTSSQIDPGAAVSLRQAVVALRGQGVENAEIVDRAVSTYCPLVAADTALDTDQKREAVRRFASALTTFVYDPAQSDDSIIVSLPLKPLLSAQIAAAAAKAKMSRDAWLTSALEAQLAGK